MRTAIFALVAASVPLLFAGPTAGGSAACPANLANGIKGARGAGQLITVEAARYETTAASLRLWRRDGGCWVPVAGAWTARVGRNGLAERRREGDGTTPAGIYTIGSIMYCNASQPRRAVPLPPARLRRLVERGSLLADLQQLPTRPLRQDARRSARRRPGSGRTSAHTGISR